MKYTITLTDNTSAGIVALTFRGELIALFDRAAGQLTAEVDIKPSLAIDLRRSGYAVEEYRPAPPAREVPERPEGASARRRRATRAVAPNTHWTGGEPFSDDEGA